MINGAFGIGHALQGYQGQQQRGIMDLLHQAQAAQQQAYTQPAPHQRGMNLGEGLAAIIASLINPQAGEGFLGGLQNAHEQENQRRAMEYQRQQQAALARAQALREQAGFQQDLLGGFQKARQFEIGQTEERRQANVRDQFNREKMAEDTRQFDLEQAGKLRRDAMEEARYNADRDLKMKTEERLQQLADAQQKLINQNVQNAKEKNQRDAMLAKVTAEMKRLQAQYYGPNMESQINKRAADVAQGERRLQQGDRRIDISAAGLQLRKAAAKEKAAALAADPEEIDRIDKAIGTLQKSIGALKATGQSTTAIEGKISQLKARKSALNRQLAKVPVGGFDGVQIGPVPKISDKSSTSGGSNYKTTSSGIKWKKG